MHTAFQWGEPDGKRPFGKPTRKWGGGDNNKMDLKEIGWEGVNLIDLAQGGDMSRAPAHAAMDLRVPYTAGDFLTSFSRRTVLNGVSSPIPQTLHCLPPLLLWLRGCFIAGLQ